MKDQVLSIKQMQELVNMGIDVSKASMCWIGCSDGNDVYPYNSTFKDIFKNHKETIPAVLTPTFTLQDILKIIKEKVLEKDLSLDLELNLINNQFQLTKEIDYRLYTSEGKTLLKSAFQMLKWCKKNKYI